MRVHELTIHEARHLLDRGDIRATELAEAVLRRIEEVDSRVHAFLTVTPERAMALAREADQRLQKGERRAMLGIPVALKDLLCTKGIRTTCGSRILEGFVPPYDATVVERLLEDGAVLVGKTNMDEFAMGSSTEHSAFGPTRNPWDLERIPGGSSGGSAAAVAAHECLASLGSDTGGSIRQPAACCGIVGLKPTYGRVSRFGLVAFASSLDQIGPMTKDVEDCALMMNCISGHDTRDSTSAPVQVPDYTKALKRELKGVRIGRLEGGWEGVDPQVAAAVEEALTVLTKLGAQQVRIDLPHLKYGVAAYYLVAPAEASSNLARYDGVKYGFRRGESEGLMEMYCRSRSEGFGSEVKRRIMLGTYALSAGYYEAYYKKACQVRTLLVRDFEEAFGACDVIAMPTAPTTAFQLGEKLGDPLQMYLSDVYTIPVNMAGVPGISVPCGFDDRGLPIGLQLVAGHFREESLIHVAFAYEQAANHKKNRPEV
ncbi:MAG: Asp-tRNA(Asn)/Glu-tRNA(Gln) amidotransferase subunit GatA [Thermodesulfobacteriota bacterium]